jgi:nitrilase
MKKILKQLKGEMLLMAKHPFLAAAVQVAPILPFNKQKTVNLICEIIAEASNKGAKLIVFPECFIPMYPNWTIDFENPNEWAYQLRDFTKQSITIPGPETDQIGAVAREKGVYVVVGVNEVDKQYSSTLYNSLVFIGPEGKVIGKHRKLFPSNREKIFHTRGDGAGLKVYDTTLGNLGGLICYEHLQPLLKYSLIAQGEQIHCASWPGWPNFGNGRTNKHVIEAASKTYALEGQSFVVASSLYVPESVAKQAGISSANWSFFGGSCIINPSGDYVTEPLYDQEGIVYGMIDLDQIHVRKAAIDTTGRDTAWDIINMNLDASPRSPILREGPESGEASQVETLSNRIKDLEEKLKTLEVKEQSIY